MRAARGMLSNPENNGCTDVPRTEDDTREIRVRFNRFIATGVATACTALVATISATTPAAANTAYGCGYPQVCFYKTQADWNARTWTAAYKDVTSYYQTLGSNSAGSFAVYNSRNDDGASLKFSDGHTTCIHPNEYATGLPSMDGYVTGIKIMDSPYC